MKCSATLIFIFSFTPFVHSQTLLSIATCYARAEANYPLIRQRALIEKTRSYSIENTAKGNLPQIALAGQATYQSEVTQIPLDLPGVQPLSKDQYRIFGEISQYLYHGGLVKEQRKTEEVNARVENQKLDVELYQLRNRVNELFFGILLLQEQIVQSGLVKQDLASGLKKIEANILQGTALRSASDVLQAELLRMDQRIIEQETAERSFREILGIFIDQPLDAGVVLEKPELTLSGDSTQRPELGLFDFQKQSIEMNRSLLSARRKPRVEFFLQGGYGRPGLNMLENSFNFYYLGGIRFNWLLSGYYTFGKEKEILTLRQQSLEVQKQTFLFNIRLTLNQHAREIEKLQRLVAVDDEIISLRTRVQKTASAQLEQGVISAADYIREVNATDQAKQNRSLHETQLLMARATYQFTQGQ